MGALEQLRHRQMLLSQESAVLGRADRHTKMAVRLAERAVMTVGIGR